MAEQALSGERVPAADLGLRFSIYLALFCFMCVFFGALLAYYSKQYEWLDNIRLVFFAINGAHVYATLAFYFDERYKQMIDSEPVKFYLVPALVIASTATLFSFLDEQNTRLFLAVYWGIFLWHFARQNVGIISFYLIGLREQRMTPLERNLIQFSWVGAYFCLLEFWGKKTFLADYQHWIDSAGLFFLCAMQAAVFYYLVTNRHAHWARLGVIAFFSMIYWFSYLFSTYIVAFFGFSMMHGFQYWLMMSVNSRYLRFRWIGKYLSGIMLLAAPAAFLLFVGVAGWLVNEMGRDYRALDPIGNAIFGAVTGFVMVHFWVDGFVWRLSNPQARAIVSESFGFLFKRS